MQTKTFLALAVLALLGAGPAAFAQSGRLVGTVTEEATGTAMPGANVIVAGTSIGAATDLNGRYILTGVPAGERTIVATYIGYAVDSMRVVIPAGGETEADFALGWIAAEGDEIVVTAQARGQLQAINEQLSSRTITNVVSAERIRELPDASAATAVSRLPGVSLEGGDRIVVRGIQAKYNTVMVNGIQLPSTSSADRGTNLGYVSSNMLSGIEVSKAVTPAMDANSIGGSVNLRLREAPEGLHYDAMLQGDYNTQDRTADNYLMWASVSNRFLNERFGVFLQGNASRSNGGADVGSATWSPLPAADVGQGLRPYAISEYAFSDEVSINDTYGGSLLLDFRLPTGKIILQNMYSSQTYDNISYTDRLFTTSGNRAFRSDRNLGDRYLLVNALQGDHLLGKLGVDWSLSHARSQNETDLNYFINFSQSEQFEGQPLKNWQSQDDVFNIAFTRNVGTGSAVDGGTNYFDYFERRLSSALNLEYPVTAGFLAGSFQAGGKFDRLNRENDNLVYYKRLSDASNQTGARDFITSLGGNPDAAITFEVFKDRDYDRGQYFLDGRRSFQEAADAAYLDRYFRLAEAEWTLPHVPSSNRNDYLAEEEVAAGYFMGDFNFGRRLNVITGVRYESFTIDNEAPFVFQTHFDGAGSVLDTLSSRRTLGHWFPNLQLRIMPIDWLDLRLAYTKTLSRPDYLLVLPSTFIDSNVSGTAGNPLLDPTLSQNFDAYLSIHENRIGLFTVGFFAKELSDVILPVNILRSTLDQFEGVFWAPNLPYPTNASGQKINDRGVVIPDIGTARTLTTYVNNPYPGYIRGLEVDWQANFWYLPRPFNSIVFNANYTRISSEMDYQVVQQVRATPLSPVVQVDTIRVGRLLQQGNDVINVALGADIRGFSGRISFRYQGDVLTGLDQQDPANDQFSQPSYGWDLALRQQLPIEGLSLFFNGVNLTHPQQVNNRYIVVGEGEPVEAPTRLAYYPRRFQIGLRYSR